MRQLSKTEKRNVTGWGATLLAIAALSVALPSVANKSDTQREAAAWAEKATAFTQYDMTAQTVDISVSRLDDLADIRQLTDLSVAHRRWAEQRAAEHQCLSEAVYYEARGESRSGQLAVADVIKNRVASKHYPNSICDVVYQGEERAFACQFSFACDGSNERKPVGRAWDQAQAIAQLSLTAKLPDLTKNATHYHTVEVNPDWAGTLKFQKQIGFHKFYRPRWRERNVAPVAMAIAPPA